MQRMVLKVIGVSILIFFALVIFHKTAKKTEWTSLKEKGMFEITVIQKEILIKHRPSKSDLSPECIITMHVENIELDLKNRKISFDKLYHFGISSMGVARFLWFYMSTFNMYTDTKTNRMVLGLSYPSCEIKIHKYATGEEFDKIYRLSEKEY